MRHNLTALSTKQKLYTILQEQNFASAKQHCAN